MTPQYRVLLLLLGLAGSAGSGACSCAGQRPETLPSQPGTNPMRGTSRSNSVGDWPSSTAGSGPESVGASTSHSTSSSQHGGYSKLADDESGSGTITAVSGGGSGEGQPMPREGDKEVIQKIETAKADVQRIAPPDASWRQRPRKDGTVSTIRYRCPRRMHLVPGTIFVPEDPAYSSFVLASPVDCEKGETPELRGWPLFPNLKTPTMDVQYPDYGGSLPIESMNNVEGTPLDAQQDAVFIAGALVGAPLVMGVSILLASLMVVIGVVLALSFLAVIVVSFILDFVGPIMPFIMRAIFLALTQYGCWCGANYSCCQHRSESRPWPPICSPDCPSSRCKDNIDKACMKHDNDFTRIGVNAFDLPTRGKVLADLDLIDGIERANPSSEEGKDYQRLALSVFLPVRPLLLAFAALLPNGPAK